MYLYSCSLRGSNLSTNDTFNSCPIRTAREQARKVSYSFRLCEATKSNPRRAWTLLGPDRGDAVAHTRRHTHPCLDAQLTTVGGRGGGGEAGVPLCSTIALKPLTQLRRV